MKKILILVISVLSLLLPLTSYGAVNYSRTPSGDLITSPVSISVSFDDFSELNCSNSDVWGIAIADENSWTGDEYMSNLISSSTNSYTFIIDLPLGFQSYGVNPTIDTTYSNICGIDLEGDGGSIIFTINQPSSVSSFPLGNAINQVSAITYDYLFVFINKFLPYLLGAILLLSILFFGKTIIQTMFKK